MSGVHRDCAGVCHSDYITGGGPVRPFSALRIQNRWFQRGFVSGLVIGVTSSLMRTKGDSDSAVVRPPMEARASDT